MSGIEKWIDDHANLWGLLSVPITFVIFLIAAEVGQAVGVLIGLLP